MRVLLFWGAVASTLGIAVDDDDDDAAASLFVVVDSDERFFVDADGSFLFGSASDATAAVVEESRRCWNGYYCYCYCRRHSSLVRGRCPARHSIEPLRRKAY